MAEFYDTLLWEYIQNPWMRGLALDKLSETYFDYEMITYDSVTQKKKINFSEVDLKEAAIYSAEDVVLTHKLYTKQQEKLTEEQKDILKNIDVPLMEALQKIEENGVYVDPKKLQEIGSILESEITHLETLIYELSGEEFNINSPKQVGEILFSKLDLPKGKKTKTWWSVWAEVLENLAKDFSIAKNIIDYRHYTKLQSTYIKGLLELLEDETRGNIIHTSYNQAVTSTGRLSSTAPNLQNIPSGKGIAWEIRKAFVSRFEKWCIMAFDYSQVEVRLLAIMSADKNLLSSFISWEDLHQKTADFLGWVERRIAKAVNFWVIYWISGFGLSKAIDISVAEGNTYIKKFYENYPGVRDYFDTVITDCEKNGYVETLFGRRRYIKGINDRNKMIKSWAEREAINMPIQWTNADIMRIAVVKAQEFVEEKELKSKLIMQVHDELVFDVFPGEEELLQTHIPEIMENILKDIPITLKTDCAFGESWKEAK